jgi:serine acetyltransferase
VIGDGVFIGPHSVVLGATLGDGVGVQAGAVVTKDVPRGVDVAGVPARPVRRLIESVGPVAAPQQSTL